MNRIRQYILEQTVKLKESNGFVVISIGDFAKLTGSETSVDFELQQDPDLSEDDLHGDWLFRIESLDVDPEYRGKGYAQELLKYTVNWCKRQGFDGIILNASPSGYPKVPLEQLVHLYSKLGFKEILDQGNNVIMFKRLK